MEMRGQEGGIERWIRLAEATGLNRERVKGGEEVLPAVRYAVDAYLDLVKNRTFLEAVASSLTEIFSRDLIALRMDALRKHYPWLSEGPGLLHGAPGSGSGRRALCFRLGHRECSHASGTGAGDRALTRKCDILWAQLDAIPFRLRAAGLAAAGSFIPEEA